METNSDFLKISRIYFKISLCVFLRTDISTESKSRDGVGGKRRWTLDFTLLLQAAQNRDDHCTGSVWAHMGAGLNLFSATFSIFN